MPNVVMDWKSESKGEFPKYPDGTYKVKITGWEEQASRGTGTPQIKWAAVITDANDKALIGGKIGCFTPLTPKALWRVANLVQACSVDLSSCGSMAVGSPAFKSVLQSCVNRSTYWKVTFDKAYNNNKVEEFIRDEKQPVVEPGVQEDPACPF